MSLATGGISRQISENLAPLWEARWHTVRQ